MKKTLKVFLIIIGVLVGIVALDTLQAKIFNNSPLFKIRETIYGDDAYYVDKGLLVNHYHCKNENTTTWKGTKYSCPVNIITLNDINDKIVNLISKNEEDNTNYAYNYIDVEKQVIVVGLVDNSQDKQEEFIIQTFSSCCGAKYIDYIKDNNLIEFKESKDVFEAQIIVAEEDYITVEVLKDSKSFKKGAKVTMKITRPTNGINDFYVVGNKVRITFNSNVEESNPAQIGAIKIELI